MSSKDLRKIRENFSKQRRRQQLQKKLSQKRKQISKEWFQQQKQTFYSIIPNISHQNYEENKLLLRDFARSLDYSYEMLPIAFISFDYLQVNPEDVASWEILAYLSYYEDFQIPQTQKFAQILLNFLKVNTETASQLLINISNLSKCSLLCCRLVDGGLFHLIDEIFRKNIQIYWTISFHNESVIRRQDQQVLIFNLLTCLSNIFAIKPILELDQMQLVCDIMNFDPKSNKFLKQVHDQTIFKLIQNAISEFPSQRKVFELLIYKFSDTLSNCFFTFEEYAIDLVRLCVQNKVKLDKRLIQNLLISIKSKNSKNKILALKTLQKILIASENKQKMQNQSPKINYFHQNIVTNSLPTFQEFNSMFTVKRMVSQKDVYQKEQISNRLMSYSVLFNQCYEKNFKTLVEIFQNSNSKVQQQIAALIKVIIKCLTNSSQQYQEVESLVCKIQNQKLVQMEEILTLTVQFQELYIFLSQSLKSSSVQIIINSLETLAILLLQFKQYRNDAEEMGNQIGYNFLLNQLQNSNIVSPLNHLMAEKNEKVTEIAQKVLNLIQENH